MTEHKDTTDKFMDELRELVRKYTGESLDDALKIFEVAGLLQCVAFEFLFSALEEEEGKQ